MATAWTEGDFLSSRLSEGIGHVIARRRALNDWFPIGTSETGQSAFHP
jgi:hypothetical protein